MQINVHNSICSSIEYYKFRDSWCDSKQSIDLSQSIPIYVLWCVFDNNFSSSCNGKSWPKNMHVSLNMKSPCLPESAHRRTLHLLIILTDDAIKHTCIWPLVWCNIYKPHILSLPLQLFLTFSFTIQREWGMKGLTMMQ